MTPPHRRRPRTRQPTSEPESAALRRQLLALIALAVAAVLVATIIATRSGADPRQVAKLADQYTATDDNPLAVPLPDDLAECRAEIYLSSGLSEGALDDIRNGKQPTARNADDIKILNQLAADLAECL